MKRKWLRSYLRVGAYTTWNVLLHALSLGRFVWLEGRVGGAGRFRTWAKRFVYRPERFAQPDSLAELREVLKSPTVRVFGAGHSFNAGVVSEKTLVSLDRYAGVVSEDTNEKWLEVKGGTRVRDVSCELLRRGLAFEALPSHDAQSIGGILSTDVHGTGQCWGFVSDTVRELEIMDAKGETRRCRPDDDLFRAAVGGIGAAGIITKVRVQAVKRFHLEQRTELRRLAEVEETLDQLLDDNAHVSLFLFPFTDRCQVNLWNPTGADKSTLGALREFLAISFDALVAAWVGDLLSHLGWMPKLSNLAHAIKRGTNLVLESHAGFNRTIYHLHQELEFAVRFEAGIETWRRFIELYETLYRQRNGLPYVLFEVRFTPAGHDRTLLGAGRGHRSTWIDLICNDSEGFDTFYEKAEKLMKEIGARPHLGKYCESYEASDLARIHAETFERFQELRREQDPEGRFDNAFTRRVFGSR